MGISTTRYNGIDEGAPPELKSPEGLAEYLGIGGTFAYQLLCAETYPEVHHREVAARPKSRR